MADPEMDARRGVAVIAALAVAIGVLTYLAVSKMPSRPRPLEVTTLAPSDPLG